MSIGALDTSLQQLTSVGRTAVAPARRQQVEEVSEQGARRQDSKAAGIVRLDEGAEQAAERLSYDQPSGWQGKATFAYQSVSRQEKREQLQQMLRVDLYA